MGEELYELPKGWTIATIGKLISLDGIFIDGDWIESKDQDPKGDVRLIQLADVGDGFYRNKSNRYLTHKKAIELNCTFLKPGDILVARMPDPLGRCCIFPGDKKSCVTVVDVCIVRTGSQGTNPSWLMYTLNSPKIRLVVASLQSGSTRKRISRSNLAQIKLPIPPLAEQHRIVTKIEELFTELDAGVELLKKLKVKLKRYRQAVLKAAVEGNLTKEWREANQGELEPASTLLERILKQRRQKWEAEQLAKMKAQGKTPKDDSWKLKYKEPVAPDTSNLPELPDGWCWANTQQLGEVQLGRQRAPKNRSKHYPTKYIRAANITEKGLDLNNILDMEFEPHERERYLLKDGDIILSEASGSPGQVGKPAIWREQLPECCFQNTVIRLRALNLSNEYLLMVFKSFYFNNLFSKIAAGVGINHLSANKFSLICVPLPPLKEQIQIFEEVERHLSVIEQLEKTINANLKRAEKLRQSILQQAFEGKLVPQYLNDEPAEQLLERIKAEKAKHEAEKKPKRQSKTKSSQPRKSQTTAIQLEINFDE